ncbi:MAG: HAMP domain-containing histidine kinase [Lachnospiraceae bacterium]|nr:HAMP domain-containing histidine kinase [Lachnospiraceae bacterium]
MKFLRNSEIRRSLILYLVLSILAAGTAWSWNRRFGVLMSAVCLLFVLLFFLITYRRYRRIAELSADIDRILHEESRISLKKYAEGELAILQCEIYKMTVRLREQQQRLREDKIYLADSIADISHQIRTPLTSINLVLSLLLESHLSRERRQELIHELYELLSRIDWLITALLKISRLDAGTVVFKEEILPIKELLQRAASPILVPMELRGQTLEIEADGEFTGDIAWTCEAILNIIKNCMEHTGDGGTISIHAESNALFTEIRIEDNGKGIAKEDLPHIFERFYKGRNSDEKSFGIGLALARMIIVGQKGTVKAENLGRAVEFRQSARSANGQTGARFTIRFYKGTI